MHDALVAVAFLAMIFVPCLVAQYQGSETLEEDI